MKRNIIFVALAATMAMTSCSKQEQYPEQAQGTGDGKTFTAVIEQQQTRTVLTTANKVEWEVGDKININGAEYSAVPKNPASRAVFIHMSGNAPQSTPYKATFPANLYNAISRGLELPSTINYKAGKLNTPMYAESSTEELSFKNICGVLRLSLTGTEKVKSIAITANETICGPFTTDIAQDGSFSMTLTGEGDACKTVTLDCGEQGVQLSDVAKDFFIPLPPKDYNGMTITVTVKNPAHPMFEKTTTTQFTIEHNTLYTLEMTADVSINEQLAAVFQEMVGNQPKFAAATDEAILNINNEANYFLPEINTWKYNYAAIEKLDYWLKYMTANERTDVPEQEWSKKELHFLRAFLYFELFKTYGQVPLVSNGSNSPNPIDNIVSFINEDIEVANSLPTSYETDKTITLNSTLEITRPTHWAALALGARTWLYAASPLFGSATSNAEKAVFFCDAIIGPGELSLLGYYQNLWGIKGESQEEDVDPFDNRELIFGVRYTGEYALAGIIPTQSLVDQYECSDFEKFIDKKPEVSFDLDENTYKDPLLEYHGPLIKDYRFDVSIGTPSPTNPDANGYSLSKGVGEDASSHVLPIFRYGEILLDMAEAKIILGDSAQARDILNQIRQRARLEALSTVDQNTLMQERLVELAFEGHRFWDVRRWEMGSTYFNSIKKAVVSGDSGNYTVTRTPIGQTWSDDYNFYPIPQN